MQVQLRTGPDCGFNNVLVLQKSGPSQRGPPVPLLPGTLWAPNPSVADPGPTGGLETRASPEQLQLNPEQNLQPGQTINGPTRGVFCVC